MNNIDTSSWKYPDDAEEHYKDLLNITRPYREHIPFHEGSGFRGPWIENYFIQVLKCYLFSSSF